MRNYDEFVKVAYEEIMGFDKEAYDVPYYTTQVKRDYCLKPKLIERIKRNPPKTERRQRIDFSYVPHDEQVQIIKNMESAHAAKRRYWNENIDVPEELSEEDLKKRYAEYNKLSNKDVEAQKAYEMALDKGRNIRRSKHNNYIIKAKW